MLEPGASRRTRSRTRADNLDDRKVAAIAIARVGVSSRAEPRRRPLGSGRFRKRAPPDVCPDELTEGGAHRPLARPEKQKRDGAGRCMPNRLVAYADGRRAVASMAERLLLRPCLGNPRARLGPDLWRQKPASPPLPRAEQGRRPEQSDTHPTA